MGCDIHLVVEQQNGDGKWHRMLPPESARDPWSVQMAGERGDDYWRTRAERTWYADRNYELFGQLADVRNRFNVTPISSPRGLPSDLSAEARALADDNADDGDVYLGEHSQSWLLVSELASYDRGKRVTLAGLVEPDEFVKWRRGECPRNYCQGVGGARIFKVTNEEMARLVDSGEIEKQTERHYYTRVEWQESREQCGGDFWTRVLPALTSLGRPDHTRIVFGFDS